jgi:hypothetical protein
MVEAVCQWFGCHTVVGLPLVVAVIQKLNQHDRVLSAVSTTLR